MRAEPHYVETLSGLQEPQPPAALKPPGLSGHDPAASAAVRTIPVLAAAVESALAALVGIRPASRPLAERVALDLSRAEVQRAHWLAQALALLGGDLSPALARVDLGEVLAGVVEALGPEQRLSGASSSLLVPEDPAWVAGDDRLLRVALGGLCQGMRLLDGGRGDTGHVVVRVVTRPTRDCRVVEFSQSFVRLSSTALDALFDAGAPAHPAGGSAVLFATARRVAEAHGGWLEVRPLDRGGCALAFGVPAWPS